MRPQQRIDVVLSAIRDYWMANPDLRLMQILLNAINPDERHPDLYYMEDDELLELLEKLPAKPMAGL